MSLPSGEHTGIPPMAVRRLRIARRRITDAADAYSGAEAEVLAALHDTLMRDGEAAAWAALQPVRSLLQAGIVDRWSAAYPLAPSWKTWTGRGRVASAPAHALPPGATEWSGYIARDRAGVWTVSAPHPPKGLRVRASLYEETPQGHRFTLVTFRTTRFRERVRAHASGLMRPYQTRLAWTAYPLPMEGSTTT